MHRCDFDQTSEMQAQLKTVSAENQAKKSHNPFLLNDTGDGTLPQVIHGGIGTRPGSHCVWEGTPSPVRSDTSQLLHPSTADTYVSNAVSCSCPTWTSPRGAAMSAPLGGANTAPLHGVYFSPCLRFWSPQNHHTNHRVAGCI